MAPRLPRVPEPDEVARHIPVIEPVPVGTARPFWSVMIPTHNGDTYLRRTLRSVCAQAPGDAEMQIEVVDDCSTEGDPQAVTREEGDGRVGFHRNPRNLGATETFNVCLRRARGRWVHVLHGDDAVLPGFYTAYRAIIDAHPDVVMVIGQSISIDEHDRWIGIVGPPPPPDGVRMPDFLDRQATRTLGQFASWITRRDVLEHVGGFCALFQHSADRELAFRVGLAGAVAYAPRPYSLYREHAGSDTSRLMVSGRNVHERALASLLNLSRLPDERAQPERRQWTSALARLADTWAARLAAAGSAEGCFNQRRWAFVLDPGPRRALRLLRAWVSHERRRRG